MAREWHGRPTKFRRGDIISHPNNPGVVCQVLTATTAQIFGVMGKIKMSIQDDPDWTLLQKQD